MGRLSMILLNHIHLPKYGYLSKVVQQNGFYSGKSYQEVEDKFLVRFTGKYC